MKDCTTCKYGYEDERLGIQMCHHPSRFFEDCVDFNMHEEKEIETERSGSSEKPNTHLEHVPEIKETGTQGLDEAAKNYALNTAEDSEQYSARYLGYKDGAKWQKEQDDKELSEKIAAAYQLGIADKEKQMMKEAVECELYYDGDFLAIDLNMAELGHSERDKVRIIVIPNTDKK